MAGAGVLVTSVLVELLRPAGLELKDLTLQGWWFLCVPAAVLWAVLRPMSLQKASAELDSRAQLGDRLGTALEFRESTASLAGLQRENAGRLAQGVEASALFRPQLAAGVRRALGIWALGTEAPP